MIDKAKEAKSSTFEKEKTFALSDKLLADFSEKENGMLLNFIDGIKKFEQKKIKAKDLEVTMILFPFKITDAGWQITGAMYRDKITPKDLFEATILKEEKMCQKCKGVGNFCKIMFDNKKKKAYSICGLCQMESF